MNWGLLGGLGQTIQQAGAMRWEEAKQKRLDQLRAEERAEERTARREDARLDREARLSDARTLAQEERDNAGKWERVTLDDGAAVLRHTVTGDEKAVPGDDKIGRAVQIYKAITQNGSRDTTLNPYTQEEEDVLKSVQEVIVSAYGRGAVGGTGGSPADEGGNKDAAIAAAMGGGQQSDASQPAYPPAAGDPYLSAGDRDWMAEAQDGLNMSPRRPGLLNNAPPVRGRPNYAPWVKNLINHVRNQKMPEKLPSIPGF